MLTDITNNQKKTTKELLVCKKCSKNYTDPPRILPCGISICNLCINSIISTNKKEFFNYSFKCELCEEFHDLPKNENFPINKSLEEIIEKDSNDSSALYSRMKSLFHAMQPKCNSLRITSNNKGIDKVQEYCLELRADIDLETEKRIDAIQDMRENLIHEVENYEKKCIEKLEKNQDINKNSDVLINAFEQFYPKMVIYEEKKKLDLSFDIQKKFDQIVKKDTKILEEVESRIIKETSYLNNKIFGYKKPEFIKSTRVFETKDIGRIKIETKKQYFPDDMKCEKTFSAHTEGIYALCLLKNGDICSGSTKKIKIWDQNTHKLLKTLRGHKSAIFCMATLNNGNICSGSMDRTIKIWNPESGDLIRTIDAHTNNVKSLIALQGPNGYLCSSSSDETIKIWNPETGEFIRTLKGHTDAVNSLIELPNGNIASASGDQEIKIWNTENGECIKTLTDKHILKYRPEDEIPIVSLALLPNGDLIGSYSDETLLIWNIDLGKGTKLIPTGVLLYNLIVLDDELICGSSFVGSPIKIWNYKTGELARTLYGHKDVVTNIVKLADGNLMSASVDRTLKIWS